MKATAYTPCKLVKHFVPIYIFINIYQGFSYDGRQYILVKDIIYYYQLGWDKIVQNWQHDIIKQFPATAVLMSDA